MSTFTKREIKNTFLEMLEEMPLNQITVKALVLFYLKFPTVPLPADHHHSDSYIFYIPSHTNSVERPSKFGGSYLKRKIKKNFKNHGIQLQLQKRTVKIY